MKFFGDAHLQQNNLREAVIPLDTSFPTNPKVGQLAFTGRILYICVEIMADGMPVWVPMTQEITAFTFVQSTESSTWVINHNLNTTSVSPTVYDELGRVVIPSEITVNSASQVTVDFGTPAKGKVVLVSGHFDGQLKPTYAFEFYQTNPSTTWVVDHGLGRQPIVRVFVGNQEVQPETVTFDSMDTITITFSTPQVGQVKLI
jgi:hypothetical protein